MMNKEKAREIIEQFKHLEKPMQDPLLQRELKLAVYSYKEAKGFIEGYESSHREALDESLAELISEYVCHDYRCILAQWEGGEPTKDGGYRSKFKGKWFQSKPIDEHPKCECGLDELLSRIKKIKQEGKS